ncbi:MAG: TIR domain-containing protein [Acidobacteria bacterium]|nr:TIR domain-containing protein [Acidobacteriota bacterium]
MSDIFISYARQDKSKAEALAALFEQQKWDVWWDRELVPGEAFEEVIARELASAKAVVALWSDVSVGRSWVKDEAKEGDDRGVLVPALIAPVKIPMGFRQIQTANLSDWDESPTHPELQKLLKRVGALIDKPVTTFKPTLWQRSKAQLRWRSPFALVAACVAALLIGYGAYRLLPRGGDDTAASFEAAKRTAQGIDMASDEGNHEGAILLYQQAIAVKNDYAPAYFFKGQSHASLGENDSAVADFKKVLSLPSSEQDLRRKSQKFIEDIQSPPPTPVPTPARTPQATPMPPSNTNAGNTNSHMGPNINAKATGSNTSSNSSTNTSPPPPDLPVQAQIGEMFGGSKTNRIAATTKLIIERKNDPATVLLAVKTATAQPKNMSGVINTLVLLESVNPSILKKHRPEIEALLDAVKSNGPQTETHIKKVRSRLDN